MSNYTKLVLGFRFLVVQLLTIAVVLTCAYITWYLGAPKLVYVFSALLAVGALLPLFEKIMGEEPGL